MTPKYVNAGTGVVIRGFNQDVYVWQLSEWFNQINKHFLCLVAIPEFIFIPNYRNGSSMVSDIWELMAQSDLKVHNVNIRCNLL